MDGPLNRRELTFKALAGFLGGAIGWLPLEIVTHGHTLTDQQSTGWILASFLAMAILSGAIGGLVRAAEGQSFELSARFKRRLLGGFLICAALSLLATYFSNVAFSAILGAGGWAVGHPGSIFYLILGRVVGWILMGVMLGAGVGLAMGSLANVAKGAVGGWLGGAVGGLAFDLLDFAGAGMLSRLVGSCALGVAIGFFIGLVQELTKVAWLTVEAGRLRGRQYRLEQTRSGLGRAEENAVGLFGDPGVRPRHAVIEASNGKYAIKNLATPEGTMVNGKHVETQELRDGDRISISNYELVFHARKGRSPAALFQPQASGQSPSVAETQPAAGEAAAAAGACLVDEAGRRFALKPKNETRIGRALDNDIVVSHGSVSRYHACIVAHDATAQVRDLESRNGTYVGERRVAEAHLASGDAVRFGDARFIFRG